VTIKVQIERLVLDGLPVTRQQGAHVRAAVERELTRLVRAHGIAPAMRGGGAVPAIRASSIACDGSTSPQTLGTRIGRAVHRSLRFPG
jgi:hypothetical protein